MTMTNSMVVTDDRLEGGPAMTPSTAIDRDDTLLGGEDGQNLCIVGLATTASSATPMTLL